MDDLQRYLGQDDVFLIEPTTPPQRRVDILYDQLIVPASRDPAMISLSRRIIAEGISLGQARRQDPVGHLQLLLDWQARNVFYQEDPTGPDGFQLELYKRPQRAISDGSDDCDGKVTVFATLAMAGGYEAVPVWIEQEGYGQNHVAGWACVPSEAAAAVAPPGRYNLIIVKPTNMPRVRGEWLWAETTLGDVRTRGGIVRGPIIGENPYDVVRRFRSAGVARLSL